MSVCTPLLHIFKTSVEMYKNRIFKLICSPCKHAICAQNEEELAQCCHQWAESGILWPVCKVTMTLCNDFRWKFHTRQYAWLRWMVSYHQFDGYICVCVMPCQIPRLTTISVTYSITCGNNYERVLRPSFFNRSHSLPCDPA